MRKSPLASVGPAQLALLVALVGCSQSSPSAETTTTPAVGEARPAISGTAVARDPMTFPAGATFEAVLQDVSRVDAPPTAIARHRIENPGKTPISFSIPFDSATIDPRRNYVVRASISVDGRPKWVSGRAHQVLTHGTGRTVVVHLRPMGSTEDEIPGDVLLAGEMTFLADAARLTECSTRRVFPISPEGDFTEMRDTYRKITRAAGAPLYVTFDGTISERPAPTGAGRTTAAVVVREFIDGWPHQTCSTSTDNAPLLDTRWNITRIADQRLTNVIGRSEPHLVLTGQGDSLAYTTTVGCNQIAGKATRVGDEIAFGVGVGTMVACGAPLDSLERMLVDGLTRATHWRIIGNTLGFDDDFGEPILLLEAARPRPMK